MRRVWLVFVMLALLVVMALPAVAQAPYDDSGYEGKGVYDDDRGSYEGKGVYDDGGGYDDGGDYYDDSPQDPQCDWYPNSEGRWDWWEYWCWWPGWGWELVFWAWA